MANGTPTNGGKLSGLSYRQAIILAIVTAVLSGSGVPWFLSAFGVNPYRDDPFTGAQGRILDKRLSSLEAHIADHPDVELRASIAELRAENAAAKAERYLMLRNQERILDQMGK